VLAPSTAAAPSAGCYARGGQEQEHVSELEPERVFKGQKTTEVFPRIAVAVISAVWSMKEDAAAAA